MFSLLSRASLCLLLGVAAAEAAPDVPAPARRWIAAVVTRVGEAGRASAARTPAGTVEIRLSVAADGSLRDVTVDRPSGSEALDARALAAARAAAPFGPPPRALLTGDGTTELSFPLTLPARR